MNLQFFFFSGYAVTAKHQHSAPDDDNLQEKCWHSAYLQYIGEERGLCMYSAWVEVVSLFGLYGI